MERSPEHQEKKIIIHPKEIQPGFRKLLGEILPEGRALPEKEWRDRHCWILLLTWLHAVALPLFGWVQGFGAVRSLAEGGVIAAAALAATPTRFSRTLRSAAASLGLVVSSAVLVQFSGGYIEAHFHFFVMLAVVAIYQDWIPYLLAILFVAVEHGLTGEFIPAAVYNHPDAFAHPWKWAVIHAVAVLGESVALLAIWRISERARARFDLLLHSAGEGIIGLDVDGIITFANPAASKMTDYPVEALVGRPIGLLLPEDGEELFQRSGTPAGELSAGNRSRRSEKTILRRDGARCFVDMVINPILEHHRVVGAVLSFKDETDRIGTEEERKRTLSLLSATIESTADGILVVDKDGKKVSLFNNKFREMWRVPDSLIKRIAETKDDRLLLSHVMNHLKDPEAFVKKVKELYSRPDAEILDNLELADGRIFERFSQPQRIENESVGRVWSFRDITERKQASEALENEVRTLESFVYTISHDLKAPVVSMHGMASVLKEECGGGISDQARHYIDRIIYNAGYMEMLILDLLELSRVGRKQQSGERVEAGRVIEEILKIHKEWFREKKIEVICQEPIPPLSLGRSELIQLFQNLITNAAKFMGDQPHPRIEIGGKAIGKGVEFFVKDNGIGIDPAYHEKIFDIFHRLQEVNAEGTGVGLPIVKKIIQANKGKIRVESEKGKGAAFFFWLPRTEPRPGI